MREKRETMKKKIKRDGHWARHKEEKFLELAPKRVNAVLEGIRKLNNLTNRLNYKYEPENVAEMFEVLEKELATCKKNFEPKKLGRPFKFNKGE